MEDEFGPQSVVVFSMFGGEYLLKPLGPRVYVLRAREAKTKGGLHLPTDSATNSNFGHVVAVGDDVEKLTIGQMVMFAQFSGKQVKESLPAEVFSGGLSINGKNGRDDDTPFRPEDLMIMHEEDVISVMEAMGDAS